MYFLPDRYLAPIGVKMCTMVELCPYVGFLVAISLGISKQGAKWFFVQFVFNVASVTCVTYNCPLMRGRAIHEWISFIQPTWGRRRHHRFTCDKLRRSSKWWSVVSIQQWSSSDSSRIASFLYSSAFDAAVSFNSFEYKSMQSATEMLPLKMGRGVAQF